MLVPTVTILGLGNILMTDEGIGVHTVNEFQRRYSVPDYVEIVDGGAAGLDLIPFIEGREKVLMVDAVNFDREPGYVDLLENEAIPARITLKSSMHHLGLMDVLSIVKMSGNYPKMLCLIGIQPKSLELGLDMTPEIWDKKEVLIEHIVNTLGEWNVPCALQSLQKSSP
jgi:hydrogenase maturation protease